MVTQGFTDLAGHPTSYELPWARDLVFSFPKWLPTCSVTSGLPGTVGFALRNSQVWLCYASEFLRGGVLRHSAWGKCMCSAIPNWKVLDWQEAFCGNRSNLWCHWLCSARFNRKCSGKQMACGAQNFLRLGVKVVLAPRTFMIQKLIGRLSWFFLGESVYALAVLEVRPYH